MSEWTEILLGLFIVFCICFILIWAIAEIPFHQIRDFIFVYTLLPSIIAAGCTWLLKENYQLKLWAYLHRVTSSVLGISILYIIFTSVE